jgi:hypothetical protein
VLSSFVVMHGPPIGPVALLCFAAAAALLTSYRRVDVSLDA